ncbi:TetR/AcrR family transcriptional regulator [Sandaracinus amylolyticus]|uniref:TetR/AcrR family transcriptional regulator n=1 Tax=Sandaracinus amylolyticus TaxID=927083 RepID=UPI001F27FE56|nr:TetR/AcrR family transcriptional regulator [Sandaracinus amylolyticus]UJR81026.1 Transcriptional regulator, TetR family protein [Sandaracinus amylolyticus]
MNRDEHEGGGLRERKKAEKEAAIRDAAAALFKERGFDATTTQAVAERAGIAKGTVFLYAPTKVDLVAMVFQDRMRRTAAQALALRTEGGLVAELDAIFGRFFAMYAKDPELARIFVKELAFATEGARRAREEIDSAFVGALVERIEQHKQVGAVRADVPSMLAAVTVFGLYIFALMGWLGGASPSVDAARAHLRASLELLVRGLAEEGGSWKQQQERSSTKERSRSAKRGRSTSTRGASETAATKRRGSS